MAVTLDLILFVLFIAIRGIRCQVTTSPTQSASQSNPGDSSNVNNGADSVNSDTQGTCSSTSQLCQPNVYIAPVINCTTGEILNELQQVKEEVVQLNGRVGLLTQRLEAAVQGTTSRGCHEELENGNSQSGVYTIQPSYGTWPFQVYCDMDSDGGGWTVFQRRLNGSEDFYRSWASYRRGFGNLQGEFWLGNDKLHQIVATDEFELRIDMQDFDDISQTVSYGRFYIENYENNYRLHVSQFNGAAGDSLSYSNNQQFSTKDRDNDADSGNCAQRHQGAWWYKSCMNAHMNGLYLGGTTEIAWNGVIWHTWKGQYYSLKRVEMKVRPVTED